MHSLQTGDFYYELPQEQIAQHPVPDRSSSRLMVLDKNGGSVSHRRFFELPLLLQEGDLLVMNNSKVIPARIFGIKDGGSAPTEFLLLKREGGSLWQCLTRPGRRAKPGARFSFGGGILEARVEEILADGVRLCSFSEDTGIYDVLERIGKMPLPPYITEELADNNSYQTVYAKEEGSAAAPTAGLHFTKELISRLLEGGVDIAYVTLHVGLGTFRPVKVKNIEEHRMHSESYCIDESAAAKINRAKAEGRRVIAVGTTSCRTVEAAFDGVGVRAGEGETNIFIRPGCDFKVIDALITNFHLPESTLLMLVSALAGRENILSAYGEAVKNGYRFFSFGDAMFIS